MRRTPSFRRAGFAPLQAELVYPESAPVEDGWVYFYSTTDVLDRLARAVAL
jgi:hypothetical protein